MMNSSSGKRCRYIDEFEEMDTGIIRDHGERWYEVEKKYDNGTDRILVSPENIIEVER